MAPYVFDLVSLLFGLIYVQTNEDTLHFSFGLMLGIGKTYFKFTPTKDIFSWTE